MCPLDNTREQVDACVEIARRAGHDFLVLDQTRPDVEVPVVRVIVPGLAAFLSPLRAGPAVRCSGQARIARPAAAGKRTDAVPAAYLRVMPPCARPRKSRAGRIAASHRRPAERTCPLEAQADGKHRRRFDGYAVGLGKFSTAAMDRAQELAHGPAARSFSPARNAIDREIDLWSGGWPAAGCWNIGWPRTWRQRPGGHRAADAGLLAADAKTRQRRHGSCCRASPICDGAATRWCWNRRAPAPCSGSAIRRSLPRSPSCRRRKNRQAPAAGRLSRDWICSDCCSIARSCSRSSQGRRRPAADEGDDNLVLWDFHDLLFHTRSTEGRQANPLGGLYPYADTIAPPPAVRAALARQGHRPAASSRRAAQRPHLSQNCCASAIRRAISTTSSRSRWPSWRNFSKAPHACSRNGPAGSILATATVRVAYTTRPYPVRRQRLRTRTLSDRRQLRGAGARLLSL